MAFVKEMRLRRAREMLVRTDLSPSVTETALACGFTNLGHFARDYFKRFGERPSETLRRRCSKTLTSASVLQFDRTAHSNPDPRWVPEPPSSKCNKFRRNTNLANDMNDPGNPMKAHVKSEDRLLDASELDIVSATRSPAIEQLTISQLKALIHRLRRAHGRAKDISASQQRETRGKVCIRVAPSGWGTTRAQWQKCKYCPRRFGGLTRSCCTAKRIMRERRAKANYRVMRSKKVG